jgi:hypothetical protein
MIEPYVGSLVAKKIPLAAVADSFSTFDRLKYYVRHAVVLSDECNSMPPMAVIACLRWQYASDGCNSVWRVLSQKLPLQTMSVCVSAQVERDCIVPYEVCGVQCAASVIQYATCVVPYEVCGMQCAASVIQYATCGHALCVLRRPVCCIGVRYGRWCEMGAATLHSKPSRLMTSFGNPSHLSLCFLNVQNVSFSYSLPNPQPLWFACVRLGSPPRTTATTRGWGSCFDKWPQCRRSMLPTGRAL